MLSADGSVVFAALENRTIRIANTLLILAPSHTKILATWDEALRYCSNLDADGSTDWYLPDKLELLCIYEAFGYDPESTMLSYKTYKTFWSKSDFVLSSSVTGAKYVFDYGKGIFSYENVDTMQVVQAVRRVRT